MTTKQTSKKPISGYVELRKYVTGEKHFPRNAEASTKEAFVPPYDTAELKKWKSHRNAFQQFNIYLIALLVFNAFNLVLHNPLVGFYIALGFVVVYLLFHFQFFRMFQKIEQETAMHLQTWLKVKKGVQLYGRELESWSEIVTYGGRITSSAKRKEDKAVVLTRRENNLYSLL